MGAYSAPNCKNSSALIVECFTFRKILFDKQYMGAVSSMGRLDDGTIKGIPQLPSVRGL